MQLRNGQLVNTFVPFILLLMTSTFDIRTKFVFAVKIFIYLSLFDLFLAIYHYLIFTHLPLFDLIEHHL